jgi:hypothetical protein
MNSKKVQKNWLRTGAVFVVLVVLSMAVVANASVYPPSWRGGAGTTLEQWSFSDSSTSPSPDAGNLHNPFGTPSLWIGDRATYFASFDSHTGVWAPKTDEMDLEIPNNPVTGDDTQKTILAEITWKVAGLDSRTTHDDSLMVGVDPEGGYTEMDFTRSDTSLGNGWFSTVVKVDIWPNPLSEWITVKGDIYIDEITIDTKCIPEPATLGLLIGGAFMALRRKRKKA